MSSYKIAETFLSINGEGIRAGQLAFFIRFAGCNLACGYCDTKWANEPQVPYQFMTEAQLYDAVKKSGSRNVTITGGEPLIQADIGSLLRYLSRDPALRMEIETNGSVPLEAFCFENRPAFTMDYKLPASGMERFMCVENFPLLGARDTVKFVCGSRTDLERALEVIGQYELVEKTNVYLSPVFGKIDPADMVEFIKAHHMNDVNLQLQLHKMIWPPEQRGV